jgi:hypothetical protein
MAFTTRNFRTLKESKAKVVRDFFKEKKKTRLEERILDRRIEQAIKDFGNFGALMSPVSNGLLDSSVFNRNLESMFYDAASFQEALREEGSIKVRVAKRLTNERSSNERELFRFEKLVKQGLFELDLKAKVAYETFFDSSLGAAEASRIVEDPKTKLTISEAYRIDPEGRGGLRLPTESLEEIRFRNCTYVYEETDFSPFELEQTVEDPSGVYLEDRVFLHTVYKPTNWRQEMESAFLTLLCELPGYQVINTINIHSVSEKPVDIYKVEFLKANLQWEEIDFKVALDADNQILLFSAIGTSQLKFYFMQRTPTVSGNLKVNKRKGETYFQGDKFEFAIAEIWAQRAWYKDIGFYETPAFEVNRAVSFSTKETMVDIRGEHADLFSTGQASTDALVDKYFIVRSNRKSNIKIDTIIPAPGNAREEELLAIYKQESFINFAPMIDEAKCIVYGDDIELALGTDYVISVDNGITWISSYEDAAVGLFIRDIPKAYETKIRLLDYDPNVTYRISYVKRPFQILDKSGAITLVNNRIAFPRRTKSFSGEVSVLYVLRSMSGNPLITPLITSYCFIAKERNNA